MLVAETLLGVVLVWGLCFKRIPIWGWLITAALWLSALVLFSASSFSIVFASLVTVIFAGLTVRPLRRWLITRHCFAPFKKILPVISPTEQAALEAGDVWWEGELFRGTPDWQQLASMGKDCLREDEQTFLDNQTNNLCSLIDNWAMSENGMDLPENAWEYMKKERFFGMIIPKEYGGLGFTALGHSSVVTRICTRSPSAAITVMVPNSLGPAELLLHYGTEEQKSHYLPRLATGQDIPCFGLTTPEAGSDAGAIGDNGVVCMGEYEGEQTLGIRLNFNKRYITLAPVASVLGIAFKLFDPENLLNRGEKSLGITLCLIPANLPGVSIGNRHLPSNTPFMNGPMRGKDVFIPMSMLIGGQEYIGQGWRMLMECLAAGRGISLPALSCASGVHCYKTTGAYSKVRQQFGLSIGRFEGVQEAMARIGGNAYALEACRRMTVSGIDLGHNPAIASAIAKCHMTEMGRESVNDAMDIHAGKGLIEGPKNYLTAYYFSCVIAVTVEGANILTRNLMIFGQGAVRCHPYVLTEIQALNHEDKKTGLKDFDKALFAHIGYSLSNLVRAFTLGFTGGKLAVSKESSLPYLRRYQAKFTRYSAALSVVTDLAMLVLGGDLKRKERLSARLGDVLAQLYIASAVMRHYQLQGEQEADKAFVAWCLQRCLYEIESAFSGFFSNFPQRWVARLMKAVVLPFGRRENRPADHLGSEIAMSMMTQDNNRARLTEIAAQGLPESDPVSQLEEAMQLMAQTETLSKKLQQALRSGTIDKSLSSLARIEQGLEKGLLSDLEAQQLKNLDGAMQAVIAVDEFQPEYFKGTIKSCQQNDQAMLEPST